MGKLIFGGVGLWASWSAGQLVCGPVDLWASWSVGELVCGWVGPWESWCVGQLVCGPVGVWASWSVGQLVSGKIGLWASWSVGQLVCGSVGLWASWLETLVWILIMIALLGEGCPKKNTFWFQSFAHFLEMCLSNALVSSSAILSWSSSRVLHWSVAEISLWQIFQSLIFALSHKKCHYQSHWIHNFRFSFSYISFLPLLEKFEYHCLWVAWIFQCFSSHNWWKFWQPTLDWELWKLCHSFINLTEWCERRVMCLQLIGDIKHMWKNIFMCCYSFSQGWKSL